MITPVNVLPQVTPQQVPANTQIPQVDFWRNQQASQQMLEAPLRMQMQRQQMQLMQENMEMQRQRLSQAAEEFDFRKQQWNDQQLKELDILRNTAYQTSDKVFGMSFASEADNAAWQEILGEHGINSQEMVNAIATGDAVQIRGAEGNLRKALSDPRAQQLLAKNAEFAKLQDAVMKNPKAFNLGEVKNFILQASEGGLGNLNPSDLSAANYLNTPDALTVLGESMEIIRKANPNGLTREAVSGAIELTVSRLEANGIDVDEGMLANIQQTLQNDIILTEDDLRAMAAELTTIYGEEHGDAIFSVLNAAQKGGGPKAVYQYISSLTTAGLGKLQDLNKAIEVEQLKVENKGLVEKPPKLTGTNGTNANSAVNLLYSWGLRGLTEDDAESIRDQFEDKFMTPTVAAENYLIDQYISRADPNGLEAMYKFGALNVANKNRSVKIKPDKVIGYEDAGDQIKITYEVKPGGLLRSGEEGSILVNKRDILRGNDSFMKVIKGTVIPPKPQGKVGVNWQYGEEYGDIPDNTTTKSSVNSIAGRNNNPLNLRNTDGEWMKFGSLEEGFRAAFNRIKNTILKGKSDSYPANMIKRGVIDKKDGYEDVMTIADLIEAWAPRKRYGGDNTNAQVDSYLSNVEARTQLPLDTKLKDLNEGKLRLVLAAMAYSEDSRVYGELVGTIRPKTDMAQSETPAATSNWTKIAQDSLQARRGRGELE